MGGFRGSHAEYVRVLLGAEKVVVIDRLPNRLDMAERYAGAETINYDGTDVQAELRERTGGRGPDVCIEAVGMEAHSPGPQFLYDQAKQQLRLQTERPIAVRDAILRLLRMYITGDTLMHDGMNAIAGRFPDIDLCLIHLGGTRIGAAAQTLRQSSLVMCEPACGPICSIPPSTAQLAPVT
jgi:hypothetical protein